MANDLEVQEREVMLSATEVVPARGLLDVASLMPQARVNRRDNAQAVEEAIAIVTVDEESAKECFFSLPKGGGGNIIQGPSVGLAETLASTWGNLVVSVDDIVIGEREVTVKGAAIDLQSGMAYQAFVIRGIMKSKKKGGQRYDDDMINTTLMAAQSILYRNLVLRLIPRPLVRRVYKAALNVATGDGDTFLIRVDNAFKYWVGEGVVELTLMRHIGVTKRSQVNLAHLEYLIGISQAIRDGAASIQDVFSRKRDSEEDAPQVAPPEDLKAAKEKLDADVRAISQAKDVPVQPDPLDPGVEDPTPIPESDPMFKPTAPSKPSPIDPETEVPQKKPAAKKAPRKPTKNKILADIEGLMIAQGEKKDLGFDHQGAYTEIVADLLDAEGLYEPGEDIDINKLPAERLAQVYVELGQQITAHEKDVAENPDNYPGSPKPPESGTQETLA